MSLTSPLFLLFLLAVVLLAHGLPLRCRNPLLLLASAAFYVLVAPAYLLGVLALVALGTYACARMLAPASGWARRGWFWGGVSYNLAWLLGLKYLPVLWRSLEPAGAPTLLVTVGLSYYVFQALAYLIDLHLGVTEVERNPLLLTLSLAFFPKLLQGPIERANDFLPQLRQPAALSYADLRSGALLFAWGLFKKTVIADQLAPAVGGVYDNVHAFSGWPLLVATWLYALQIYADFSGYTDMALGSARLFGLRLTQNFNQPYAATSVADFWRRWHISFSRWILDYLFRPLQMLLRNGRSAGMALALLVTFLLSGAWHGATLGFLAWGGVHGLYLAASTFYRPWQKRLYKALKLEKSRALQLWQICVTFQLVALAWVFFRARSLEDAWYVLSHAGRNLLERPQLAACFGGQSSGTVLPALAGMLLVFAVDAWRGQRDFPEWLQAARTPVRWACYYALLIAMLCYGQFGASSFIYFQF